MAGILTRRVLSRCLVRDRKYSICPVFSMNHGDILQTWNSNLIPYHDTKPTLINGVSSIKIRFYCKNVAPDEKPKVDDKPQKLTLFQRFKQMYRDYWYVLVPVHLVTSAAWFGGFYYMARSGVDIVAILESMHVSESITNSLKDSSMGYIAISYALYKIATPLRYTVTLGGTTVSINYLKKFGYIKPVPSREELKEMYKEQKDNIIGKKQNLIISVKEKKEELKNQKDDILRDVNKSIQKISDNIKDTK